MSLTESERPFPPPPSVPTPHTIPPPPSGTVPTTGHSGLAMAPTPTPPGVAQAQALANGRRRQNSLPPRDEVADDEFGVRTEADFAPEQALDEQIGDLEAWVAANERADRRDLARFWLLRGMAFLGACAAVAGGTLEVAQVAIVAGAITATAIAVDSAWPSATDRTARRRAIRELRELQNTLKLKWDKVRLAYPITQSARRIAHALTLLDAAQAKREEIGKYLGDATPGVGRPLGTSRRTPGADPG